MKKPLTTFILVTLVLLVFSVTGVPIASVRSGCETQ